MKINIKKLTTTAKIPTRGSEYAAGYDLYADINKELVIEPHETAKIGTGLSIEIPDGYFGAVFARSGLAAKQALRPANCGVRIIPVIPCFLAILSISTDSSSDFEPSSTPYNKWQCISIKIHGPPFCFPELSLYYIQIFRAIL